jgi:Flp pilus assembly protein TadG
MRSLLNRRGQSIVEITLMTPLILVALYVPFDFGVTIFTGHITQNAVRDGARIASSTFPLDDTKAGNLAQQFEGNLPDMLVSRTVTVNYRATGGGANCAQNVEVIAQGTYNFFLYRLIALLGFTPPDAVQITRTTRMWYGFQPATNGGSGTTIDFCATVTSSGTYPAS